MAGLNILPSGLNDLPSSQHSMVLGNVTYNDHIGTLEVGSGFGPSVFPSAPSSRIARVDFDGRIQHIEITSTRYAISSSGLPRTEISGTVISDEASAITGNVPIVTIYRSGGAGERMFIEEINVTRDISGSTRIDLVGAGHGSPVPPAWAEINNILSSGAVVMPTDFAEPYLPKAERPLTMKEVWAD